MSKHIKNHLFFIILSLIWLYFCWDIVQSGFEVDPFAKRYGGKSPRDYPLQTIQSLLCYMTLQFVLLLSVECWISKKWRLPLFLLINLLFLIPVALIALHASPELASFLFWQLVLFLLIVLTIGIKFGVLIWRHSKNRHERMP